VGGCRHPRRAGPLPRRHHREVRNGGDGATARNRSRTAGCDCHMLHGLLSAIECLLSPWCAGASCDRMLTTYGPQERALRDSRDEIRRPRWGPVLRADYDATRYHLSVFPQSRGGTDGRGSPTCSGWKRPEVSAHALLEIGLCHRGNMIRLPMRIQKARVVVY